MRTVFLLALVLAAASAGRLIGVRPIKYSTDCVGGADIVHTYTFSDEALSWHDADASCKAQGGNLASIHNDAIEDQIQELVAGVDAWIGLYDPSADESGFSWTDGSCVNYEAWAPGEPNELGDEDCVHIAWSWSLGGGWNDQYCGTTFRYVCQFVPAPETPETPLSGLTQMWWYRRATDTMGCFNGANCACYESQNPPAALTDTFGYTVGGDTTACDSAGLGTDVPTAEILVLDDGPCNFQWDNFEGAVVVTRDSGFSCMFESMFGTDAYGTIWEYTGSDSVTWTQPSEWAADTSFSGDSVIYTNVIDEAGYTEGDFTIVWRPDIMNGYFTGYEDMSAFGVFMITRNTDGRSWCWIHMGPTDTNMEYFGMTQDRFAEIMDYGIQHSDCYTMPVATKTKMLAAAAAHSNKDISSEVASNHARFASAPAMMVKDNSLFAKSAHASAKTAASAATEQSTFSLTTMAVVVPVAAVALVVVAAVVRSRKVQEYESVPVEEEA